MAVDVTKALTAPEAKALIRKIVEFGTVRHARNMHLKEKQSKRNVTSIDVENVLRGGFVSEPEWENGEWRYQVRTGRIAVVVVFDSETSLGIITTWRLT